MGAETEKSNRSTDQPIRTLHAPQKTLPTRAWAKRARTGARLFLGADFRQTKSTQTKRTDACEFEPALVAVWTVRWSDCRYLLE
jgi:hypothetical protein